MLFPRAFTVDEANALVPLLAERFKQISALLADGRRLQTALEEAETQVDTEGREGSRVAVASAGHLGQELSALEASLREHLWELMRAGVQVKALEPATVDVRALRKGQPVNLCWREGEPAFGHWHQLDETFADRHAIEDDGLFGATAVC